MSLAMLCDRCASAFLSVVYARDPIVYCTVAHQARSRSVEYASMQNQNEGRCKRVSGFIQ
jgi:hypothetical protein